MDCRPYEPLCANIYAPDLCVRNGTVDLIFVIGCVYDAPVPWSLRREKICDCEMVEVQIGISMYEMRHTCIHRPLVELFPMNDIVTVSFYLILAIIFLKTVSILNTALIYFVYSLTTHAYCT